MGSTASQDSAPHIARLEWIDVLRGVAILLVVVGHSLRGLFDAGVMDQDYFAGLDRGIYSFHMPLFFLISGLFYMRSTTTLPAPFIQTKIKRLLYPMILWTYLFVLAKLAAGPLVNTVVSLEDLWVSPIPGRWHFWFLWALFLMQIALYALRPLQTHESLRTPVLVLVLLGSICLSYTALLLSAAAWPWIGSAVIMLPYFVIGIIIGDHLNRIPQSGVVPIVAIIVLLLGFTANIFAPLQNTMPAILIAIILSVSTVLACAASQYLPVMLSTWLSKIGRATMAIFLLHTIFSASLREVLLVLGIQNVNLHILFNVGIGIVGPVSVLYLARRLHLVRVLGF